MYRRKLRPPPEVPEVPEVTEVTENETVTINTNLSKTDIENKEDYEALVMSLTISNIYSELCSVHGERYDDLIQKFIATSRSYDTHNFFIFSLGSIICSMLYFYRDTYDWLLYGLNIVYFLYGNKNTYNTRLNEKNRDLELELNAYENRLVQKKILLNKHKNIPYILKSLEDPIDEKKCESIL